MATAVVYVGDRELTVVPDGRHRYTFRNRVALRVPGELAGRLLRSGEFLSEDEFAKTAQDRWPEGGLIVVKRWGAVGDLIMLRAVLSAYRRLVPGFRPVLRCQPCYRDILASDPMWAGQWPLGATWHPRVGPDGVLGMNQVAEQDHRGQEEHRAVLFARAMTRAPLAITAEDWDIPIAPEAQSEAMGWLRRLGLARPGRSRPLVALQVRGSGPMKSLPAAQVRAISQELARDCDVVLIEHSPAHVWGGDHIYAFTERDVPASVAMLRECDLCVCFDSGALWMAHWSRTPVLCLMGPTRPEQRISMHTAAARAIRLNDLIECPSCFERAERCHKTFACMQQNKTDLLVPLVAGEARKMLAGDVALPVAAPKPAGWAPPSEIVEAG